LSCHKELVKNGDIYEGYIHFRDAPSANVDGEFRVTYVKETHSIFFDKSPDIRIKLIYNKKTKEFVGDFYWNNFSRLFYYRGKKINGDFIITLFYIGDADVSKNSPPILAKKKGDIFLTLKQN